MTHTLHRLGSIESLKDDYIVLIMRSREIDRKAVTRKPVSTFGASRFIRQIISQIWERNPNIRSNIRKMLLSFPKVPEFPGFLGDLQKSLLRSVLPPTTVFNNKADLVFFLKRLKNMNVGLSVIVSGLFSEVDDCLKTIGICPHTVEFSLGIFGKKELLPRERLLRITTMCGHHMISPRLVEKLLYDVKKGRMTYEEAAEVMAKQCVCGAFNIKRGARLMKALASGR